MGLPWAAAAALVVFFLSVSGEATEGRKFPVVADTFLESSIGSSPRGSLSHLKLREGAAHILLGWDLGDIATVRTKRFQP